MCGVGIMLPLMSEVGPPTVDVACPDWNCGNDGYDSENCEGWPCCCAWCGCWCCCGWPWWPPKPPGAPCGYWP